MITSTYISEEKIRLRSHDPLPRPTIRGTLSTSANEGSYVHKTLICQSPILMIWLVNTCSLHWHKSLNGRLMHMSAKSTFRLLESRGQSNVMFFFNYQDPHFPGIGGGVTMHGKHAGFLQFSTSAHRQDNIALCRIALTCEDLAKPMNTWKYIS